jgi:hypothetical protein
MVVGRLRRSSKGWRTIKGPKLDHFTSRRMAKCGWQSSGQSEDRNFRSCRQRLGPGDPDLA